MSICEISVQDLGLDLSTVLSIGNTMNPSQHIDGSVIGSATKISANVVNTLILGSITAPGANEIFIDASARFTPTTSCDFQDEIDIRRNNVQYLGSTNNSIEIKAPSTKIHNLVNQPLVTNVLTYDPVTKEINYKADGGGGANDLFGTLTLGNNNGGIPIDFTPEIVLQKNSVDVIQTIQYTPPPPVPSLGPIDIVQCDRPIVIKNTIGGPVSIALESNLGLCSHYLDEFTGDSNILSSKVNLLTSTDFGSHTAQIGSDWQNDISFMEVNIGGNQSKVTINPVEFNVEVLNLTNAIKLTQNDLTVKVIGLNTSFSDLLYYNNANGLIKYGPPLSSSQTLEQTVQLGNTTTLPIDFLNEIELKRAGVDVLKTAANGGPLNLAINFIDRNLHILNTSGVSGLEMTTASGGSTYKMAMAGTTDLINSADNHTLKFEANNTLGNLTQEFFPLTNTLSFGGSLLQNFRINTTNTYISNLPTVTNNAYFIGYDTIYGQLSKQLLPAPAVSKVVYTGTFNGTGNQTITLTLPIGIIFENLTNIQMMAYYDTSGTNWNNGICWAVDFENTVYFAANSSTNPSNGGTFHCNRRTNRMQNAPYKITIQY